MGCSNKDFDTMLLAAEYGISFAWDISNFKWDDPRAWCMFLVSQLRVDLKQQLGGTQLVNRRRASQQCETVDQ